MQYTSGTCGRVFYLHIDHGEDPIQVINHFIQDQTIRAGVIHFIGAVKKGKVVTGPEKDTLPPEIHVEPLDLPHEVIGTAFIRWGSEGPAIHMHVSAGRGDAALTGCLRGTAEVYIIIEVVIIEFTGIEIPLAFNKEANMNLPRLSP